MPEEKAVTVLGSKKTDIVPVDMPIMDKLLMAANSGMDIAVLEKFMDLAERSAKIEAKKAYNEAFAEFKKNPPRIVKDALVDYKKKDGSRTRYTHVSLGNLTFGIISGMSKYGLSHNWTLAQSGNTIRVTCVVTHSLGHSESTFLEAQADTSGGKNAIQGLGSTVKYLERYTLEAISGIAVFEKDDDGQSHKEPDPEEKQPAETAPPATKEEVKAGVSPQEIVALEKWLDAIDAFTTKTLDEWLLFDDGNLKPAMADFSQTSVDKFNIARKEMASNLSGTRG